MNFILPNIGTVIIPTDFHSMIFQRGRAQPALISLKTVAQTTNQGQSSPHWGFQKKTEIPRDCPHQRWFFRSRSSPYLRPCRVAWQPIGRLWQREGAQESKGHLSHERMPWLIG